MRRAVILGALILAGALSTALGAASKRERLRVQQQPASAADIQVDKIGDNLYVMRGGGGNTAAFLTAWRSRILTSLCRS